MEEIEFEKEFSIDELLKKELEELERIEKERKEREKKLQEAKKKGVITAEISLIEFGKRADFQRPEAIQRLGRDPNEQCVRIVAEAPKYDIRVVRVYKRSLHENSNWYKFLKRYGA